MIQIKRNNLDELANKHYENCNHKNDNGTYYHYSLIARVKRKRDENNANLRLRNFYQYLCNDDECSNLKRLVTSNFQELTDIKLHIQNNIFNGGTHLTDQDEIDDISSVFFYSNYDSWKAYEFAEKLNVNVCPYCNRQYTFTTFQIGGTKKVRPEFDHFYPKRKFPYLALSFYNLVPSCHTCNHLKKDDLLDGINPYHDEFGNQMKFITVKKELSDNNNITDGINFLLANKDHFDIDFYCFSKDEAFKKKAERNIKAFLLKDFYNKHKDYVQETIQKAILYDTTHVDDLFEKYEGKLFSSKGEIIRMYWGNYINEEDLDKRVLAKLTKDIIDEYQLSVV